jgi:hypothetical protein
MAMYFNLDGFMEPWSHGAMEPLLEPWMMVGYIVNISEYDYEDE